MEIFIWVLQVFLALMALPGSIANLTLSPEKLKTTDFYSAAMTTQSGKFMGVWMILAAIGMILPWALQLYPYFTPIASFNMGLILITATWVHFSEGVYKKVPFTILLAVGYLFVAYMRFTEWVNMVAAS